MLQSMLNNLKNIKTSDLAKELRNLSPESLKNMANQVASQARASTEEELRKVVAAAAQKIVDGRNDVTAEVKAEVAVLVGEIEMTPAGVLSQIKDNSHFFKTLLPRTIGDVKNLPNLRSSVGLALVGEAQRRIASRKAEEVAGRHRLGGHGGRGGHNGNGGHSGHNNGQGNAQGNEGGNGRARDHAGGHNASKVGGERGPKSVGQTSRSEGTTPGGLSDSGAAHETKRKPERGTNPGASGDGRSDKNPNGHNAGLSGRKNDANA